MPILFLFSIITIMIPAYAAQNTMSDPNLQVTLNYPDIVKHGNGFVLSTVVKATADQISNITVTASSPELDISQSTFFLDKLAKDSTFGNNFQAVVKNTTPDGTFVTNIEIEYFIKGYFDSQPVKHAITQAFQFDAESKPSLTFDLQTPNNIFSGEQFSVKGTVKNQGTDAQNIQIGLDSQEIDLEGKKSLSISSLPSGKTSDFEFVVQTQKEIGAPKQFTVHLGGTYSDDSGKTYPVDNSFNIFVRQRGILEIGDANGIWLGNFFIAPVVGVGTIVSSVIGFFIFVWHYRNKKKAKKKSKR